MNRTFLCRILPKVCFAVLSAAGLYAADVRRLTLDEAVRLAISQNRELKIARLKVTESEQKKAGEHSGYFPRLANQSNALHITALETVSIPPGAFGSVGGALIPSQGIALLQGAPTVFSSGTQLSQSLTPLIRTYDANRMAAADVAISRQDLKKAENQVALEVHTLYFGILIARLRKQAAEEQSSYAGENLRESEDDVRNGSALKVAAIQGRASLLQSQQASLTAELQLEDLNTQLNDTLGLPLDTQLELAPAAPANFDQRPREEYVKVAWSGNPEILAAQETVGKAQAALAAAKTAYIPDITAYARYSYQDGVPFLVRNFGTFGALLTWDVFDFGKRRSDVREREAELAEAEENLKRLQDEVAVAIERSYNKLERTRSLVQVASQVVSLRQESERVAQNELTEGVILASARKEATAATYQAQADFLEARLGYDLAWAELEQAIGRTPGLQ
jgi:outer membrane protein TolC